MKKIKFLLAFILTAFIFTAKAQYANMPKPVITKNVSAYTATKLSFSPDSRYLAVEYKDVLEKKLTTIIEVATGQEVTASKTGYPWKEIESTKYKVESNKVYFVGESGEQYYGQFRKSESRKDKAEYTNIIDKITKKPIYGIDECVRGRQILNYDYLTKEGGKVISPDNNLVAFISYTAETEHERKRYKYASNIAFMIELQASIDASKVSKEKIEKAKQEEKQTQEPLIQLDDKIAQIEIFRISELPKYKSFIMPTIKIPKEISVDDCFCVEYAEIRRNEGDTINYKFKYGIASRSKIIIEPKYESVELVDEKYASIKQNGKYSFVELATGKEIVTNLENIIEYYSGYISYITDDYEPVTMNLATYQKFHFVIESKLEEINSFLVMNIDDENSVMDKKGNLLIPFYRGMRDGTKKFQFVVKNAQNLWGVVGKQAASILPFEYEALGSYFSEGLIPAVKNKKLGYVNDKNQIVIPFQYDYNLLVKEKAYFENGKAQLSLNGKEFWIDKTGKCIEGCN